MPILRGFLVRRNLRTDTESNVLKFFKWLIPVRGVEAQQRKFLSCDAKIFEEVLMSGLDIILAFRSIENVALTHVRHDMSLLTQMLYLR